MIENLINKAQAVEAIEILRKINQNFFNDPAKKKPLLEEETSSTLFLQILLKKVPKTKSIKMIKIKLPHSLIRETTEVCLIAGDSDKKNHKADIEPDILHYKELLNKHHVTRISEIITLRQLRTEYKPYEKKQQLVRSFDVFLVDNRITECLPRTLGKHIFKKRKFPIQLNMKTRNLKQQIDKALSTKVFYYTGRGNSCCCEIAYLDMEDSEIVDNMMSVIEVLAEKLPGHWDNVLGVYLKTAKSKAIPLYMSYDDITYIKDEKEKVTFEIGDLSTKLNTKVKVFSDGRVEDVRIKDEKFDISEIKEEVEVTNSDSHFEKEHEEIIKVKSEPESPDSCTLLVPKKRKTKKSIPVFLIEDSVCVDESSNKNKKARKKSRIESAVHDVCDVLNASDQEKNVKHGEIPVEVVENSEVLDESSKSKKSKKDTNKSKAFDECNNDVSMSKQAKEDIQCNKSSVILNENSEVLDVSSKSKKSKKGPQKSKAFDECNSDVNMSKQAKKDVKCDKSSPILTENSEALDVPSKSKKPKKALPKSKAFDECNNDVNMSIQTKEDVKYDKSSLILTENSEVLNVPSKSKKSKKAPTKSKAFDECNNVNMSMQAKEDVKYDKSSLILNENSEELDESSKSKKSKKNTRKGKVFDEGSMSEQAKKDVKYDTQIFTESVEECAQLKNKNKNAKKLRGKIESNIPHDRDSNIKISDQVKKDAKLKKRQVTEFAEKVTSVEELESKKVVKRKRNESESLTIEENDNDRTSFQVKKRTKLENIHKKPSLALKEALRSRKKKGSRHQKPT